MDRHALEDPNTVRLVRSDDHCTPLASRPPTRVASSLSHPGTIGDRAHQRTIDWAPAKAPMDLERAL